MRCTNTKKGSLFLLLMLTVVLCVSCSNVDQQPQDSQISEAYQKAREAMGWFQLDTMPIESGVTGKIEFEGGHYDKVKHPTIGTLSQLKAYLEEIFTEDIVQSLLENSTYRDIDGSLYVQSAARGADITKGRETYEIIRESDKRIIYRVMVENLDPELEKVVGYDEYDMIYEFIKRKWVFSKFNLVR